MLRWFWCVRLVRWLSVLRFSWLRLLRGPWAVLSGRLVGLFVLPVTLCIWLVTCLCVRVMRVWLVLVRIRMRLGSLRTLLMSLWVLTVFVVRLSGLRGLTCICVICRLSSGRESLFTFWRLVVRFLVRCLVRLGVLLLSRLW